MYEGFLIHQNLSWVKWWARAPSGVMDSKLNKQTIDNEFSICTAEAGTVDNEFDSDWVLHILTLCYN